MHFRGEIFGVIITLIVACPARIHGTSDILIIQETSTLAGTAELLDDCVAHSDCKDYPEKTKCATGGKCMCNDDHAMYRDPIDGLTCVPKRSKVGESCVMKQQCLAITESDCLPDKDNVGSKICNCTAGHITDSVRTSCYPIKEKLGDVCDISEQCIFNIGEWSECNGRQCACKSRALDIGNGMKCVPFIDTIGGECLLEAQCTRGIPGEHSECVAGNEPNKKNCRCVESAVHEPDQHKCYPKVPAVGDLCEVNIQCESCLGDLSTCSADECACKKDIAISNINRDHCLPVVNVIGQPCVENQQCTEGVPGGLSECIKSECSCTEVSIEYENKCLLKADVIGGPCSQTVQCHGNLGNESYCDTSVPDNGKCECLENTVPQIDNKKCLPIRNTLEDPCTQSNQCTRGTPGKYSECKKNKCVCVPDANHEPNKSICLPTAAKIGDQCNYNSQCQLKLGLLAMCVAQESCQCLQEWSVANKDGTLCLPVINEFGRDCEEHAQCNTGQLGAYSECSLYSFTGKSVCICNSESIYDDKAKRCMKLANKLEDECSRPEQCVRLGNLTTCISDHCDCIPNEGVPNTQKSGCIPVVNTIGGECTLDNQCKSGKPGPHSTCDESNTCQCIEGTLQDPNGETCYDLAVGLGDGFQCAITAQCTANLGEFAYCNTTTSSCLCSYGSVANLEGEPNTYCLKKVLVGQDCVDKAQCPGTPDRSSTCSNQKTCGCLSGYTASILLADCLRIRSEIGEPCTEKQQCQQGVPGSHSECRETPNQNFRSCQCTVDAVTETNQHVCYKKATQVGEACQVNEQCVSNLIYSHCLDKSCQCFDNSTASANKRECVQTVGLGESCKEESQCNHISYATCNLSSGECECVTPFIPHPSKPNTCIRPAVYIGDSCVEHASLCDPIPAATCSEDDHKCSCNPLTHVASTNKRECLEIQTELRAPCKEDTQCKITGSTCLKGTSNIPDQCVCRPNNYIEFNSTTCLPIRHAIGEHCEDVIQCQKLSDRAECRAEKCECPAQHQYYLNDCYIPSSLNASCNVDEECKLSDKVSVCHRPENTCQCKSDAMLDSGKCWEIKLVGDKCGNTAECTKTIKGPVSCRSGECTCTEGTSKSVTGLTCAAETLKFSIFILMAAALFVVNF